MIYEDYVLKNGVCAMASTEFCEAQKDCIQCQHGKRMRLLLAEYEALRTDIDRLRELCSAERDGRVVVLPVSEGSDCATPNGNAKVCNWDICARVEFTPMHGEGKWWHERYADFSVEYISPALTASAGKGE